MSMKNGGPAFPTPDAQFEEAAAHIAAAEMPEGERIKLLTKLGDVSSGMTLRDYFAAKAMQSATTGGMEGMSKQGVAEWAYGMADAMLKAREAA